ncbi:MAG: uracil-DNA glycosylase [Bacteroidales bacterium]
MSVKINESWKKILSNEFESDYFIQLKNFLVEEKKSHTIYPPGKQIFAAFDLTPFDEVKVVILGQDPYHGAGQACGLCFSVQDGVKPPPSLQNIFKELENDVGVKISTNGNLEKWAKQGVLLLNATLTVRANIAGSHQNKGWEIFTDNVIKALSEQKEGLIFILWGNYAQAKETLINTKKHYVLKAAHPSPFSVYRGFFGCKHFSKTNDLLRQMGQTEINWKLI